MIVKVHLGQQHWCPLGAGWKCTFLSPTLDPLNQSLGQGPGCCGLTDPAVTLTRWSLSAAALGGGQLLRLAEKEDSGVEPPLT